MIISRCWSETKNTKIESTMEEESSSSSSSSSSVVKIKKSWSRCDVCKVVDRIIRSMIKSVTRIFAYKDFEDIENEKELVIGLPTDVKHVTHIGYDGTVTTNSDKIWDHLLQPPETLSFPCVSLQQLELQMTNVQKRDP